jgi:hypothetical protein
MEINDGFWKLNNCNMPIVTQASHIGIQKSRGLFDISATSSAQVGAQQFILSIFPPKPELESMSNNGFIYTLYKSALKRRISSSADKKCCFTSKK